MKLLRWLSSTIHDNQDLIDFCQPSNIKVYFYDLPKQFLPTDELSLVSETFYGIRNYFKNCHSTEDPNQADYFFVPVNLVQYQFRNEDPKSVLRYLKFLSSKKDHILVAAGDFSQRSKRNHYGNAYKNTYDWLNPFILLALESTSDLIPGQDIGIIPFNTLSRTPVFKDNSRPYLYSFLGETNHVLLPQNHVRSKISKLEKKNDTFIGRSIEDKLKRKLQENYMTEDAYELMGRNSVFTLAPAGYGRWTYRFFQAIQWGSIPVLLSDDYIKPFSDVIPYRDFSVTVPEADLFQTDKILRNISPAQIANYQRNLRNSQYLFTKGSFFRMLVNELEARLA
jgi:hypothetical protein